MGNNTQQGDYTTGRQDKSPKPDCSETSSPKHSFGAVAGNDLDTVRTHLTSVGPGGLLITDITDARLRPELAAIARLRAAAENIDATVADLRRENSTRHGGMQPEALYQLAEKSGLHLQTITTAPGRFNALFLLPDSTIDGRRILPAGMP